MALQQGREAVGGAEMPVPGPERGSRHVLSQPKCEHRVNFNWLRSKRVLMTAVALRPFDC